MKKSLLLLLLSSTTFVGAQVLQSDNFNTLTLGNVGTDITGAIEGQGGWLTASSNGATPTTGSNANVSNFQIVTTGNESTQGLKITSSNGNKGNRFMWKDGLLDAWETREAGNEIIEVEYDLFTGPATASTAQVGARLYGLDESVTPAASRVLNGFVYTMNTRVLQGVAYLLNGATYGTYLITLDDAPLVLDANTWYRIGFAYDTTSGETIWKGATVYTGLPEENWAGPFVPREIDFVSAVPTSPVNAAVSDMIFDNYTVKATPEEGLLGTSLVAVKAKFSVSPNPASSFVSVNASTDVAINTVEMFDINGRMVKSLKVDNLSSANVSLTDLSSGVYMMKITSDKGSETKKVIKQ